MKFWFQILSKCFVHISQAFEVGIFQPINLNCCVRNNLKMTDSLGRTSLYCSSGVIRMPTTAHPPSPHTHKHPPPQHTHIPLLDCFSTGPVGISPERMASPSSISSITGYHGHIFTLRSFLHSAVINGCFQNHCRLPGQGSLNWMLTGVSATVFSMEGLFFYSVITCISCWQQLLWYLLCRWENWVSEHSSDLFRATQLMRNRVGSPALLDPLPFCSDVITWSRKTGPQAPWSSLSNYPPYWPRKANWSPCCNLWSNWVSVRRDLLLLRYVLAKQEYVGLGPVWQDNFPVKEEEFGTWWLLWAIIPRTIDTPPLFYQDAHFISLLSLDRPFRDSVLCSSFQGKACK